MNALTAPIRQADRTPHVPLTITNLVVSVKVADALDLKNIECEPEVFPGLIYRSEAGGVALVFTSGAMIITGTLSIDQAQAVSDKLWHVIDSAGAWMRT